jgi:hypothetical protein
VNAANRSSMLPTPVVSVKTVCMNWDSGMVT